MYCFDFSVTNLQAPQITGIDWPGTDPGKPLLKRILPGLVAAGFGCSDIAPKDWGWCSQARKNGTTYVIGCQTKVATNSYKARVFVSHDRSLVDRLLGRNRSAPQNYSEKSLREALKALPGISDLQETQIFGQMGDNSTFAEIRQ